MDGRCVKFFPCPLLLLWAVMATTNPVDGQNLRDEWCYRVCPNEAPVQSIEMKTPHFECTEGLQCPPPVCPRPECPTPEPPRACPVCPGQAASSPDARVWGALKTYTSTPLGYYKYYVDVNLDWFDAQLQCESDGAHLLVLNSQEEDSMIRKAMRHGWIHIGVHHLIPGEDHRTVLGQPLNSTGFTKWLSGHVNRNESNNCGFINKSKSGLGMGLCSDTGRFICEI